MSRKVRITVLIVVASIITGCAHDTIVSTKNDMGCPLLGPYPSLDGMLSSSYSGEDWRYEWTAKGVVQDRIKTEHASPPQVQELSPDGGYRLVSSHPGASRGFGGRDLYLVETNTGSPVRAFHSLYDIDSVAWSPDSRYFATLERKEVSGVRTFKDLIITIFFSGIRYDDIYLEVYDLEGNDVCSTRIAEELPMAYGNIYWH